MSDLAEAHLAALNHLLGVEAHQEAFNVGTGSGLTVMEVLRGVEQVTGKKVPYELSPQARRRRGIAGRADSTKLRTALGWEPRRSSLEQIIRDSWDFHQRKESGRAGHPPGPEVESQT